MTKINGATAVVVGASSGIGLALVHLLVRQGAAKVFAAVHEHYPDSLKTASNVVVEVIESVDVADSKSVQEYLGAAVAGRKVDYLFVCAGTLGKIDKFGALDYSDMTHTLQVNTLGPIRVVETLFNEGALQRDGRVAVLSSILSQPQQSLGWNGLYGYRISKAGLNMAVHGLAADLRGHHVAIMALHPGYVDTPMTAQWKSSAKISAEKSAKWVFARTVAMNMAASGSFDVYVDFERSSSGPVHDDL